MNRQLNLIDDNNTDIKFIKDVNLQSWKVINKKIEQSKIKRFPWKKILGETLTHYIISRKIKKMTIKQVYRDLLDNNNIKKYIKNNIQYSEKIKENLKISVCARFGENNSSLKTYHEFKQ